MRNKETKKTIRIFALASFLNDMGSDMIHPVWPMFVTTILGANMAVLGFIDGLGEALVSISQAVSGYLSDRMNKRKIFIWLGYLCGSLSRVGYGLATLWQHLIPFKILDRAGKIRSAPKDAYVADISTNNNRGGNFGLLRAMDNLGAVCGILICILFFKVIGYKTFFLLAAIPSVLSTLLILFFIREKNKTEQHIFKGLSFKDLSGNFRLYLLLSVSFALGSFSYSFLLIFAKTFGFRTTFVPVLYLIFTLTASLFSLPFGKLSDKIGRKNVLGLSFVLWSLVCAINVTIQNYVSIILTFIFYGLHIAALDPVQRTFVCELAPERYRASALGGYKMIIGLCALPASLIAGLLWDKVGILAPFYLSLGLTGISMVMLAFVNEENASGEHC